MTSHYRVDLSDPLQRDLFMHGRTPTGPVIAPADGRQAPEVVQLAGDEGTGLRSSVNLSSGKQEVVVVFGDLLLTVDVYVVPGEPLKIHLYCPRCRKHMVVPGDRKEIDFDPAATNPILSALVASGRPELVRLSTGRLSIESFECPWEMGDDKHVRGGLHTGATLCRQRLVIDNNRARSA